MDKRRVISALLDDARKNEAYDAVVVDVPPDIIRDNGGLISGTEDEHGRRVDTTLFAGPIKEESESHLTLKTPSRVGGYEDFSDNIRRRVVDEVYGFRDGSLDGVPLPKEEIDVYRVNQS